MSMPRKHESRLGVPRVGSKSVELSTASSSASSRAISACSGELAKSTCSVGSSTRLNRHPGSYPHSKTQVRLSCTFGGPYGIGTSKTRTSLCSGPRPVMAEVQMLQFGYRGDVQLPNCCDPVTSLNGHRRTAFGERCNESVLPSVSLRIAEKRSRPSTAGKPAAAAPWSVESTPAMPHSMAYQSAIWTTPLKMVPLRACGSQPPLRKAFALTPPWKSLYLPPLKG
mmetsp:Transcript_21882/g.55858  ORF Transcript_21882/g.55858 Transcript_21882/m.55858 type:complete len:225 (-) Transcript_21882:1101-1775(-)